MTHLFVGHVFNREQMDDFREAVAKGIQMVGASLWFADQHPGTGHIFDKVKAGIDDAFACLFEISDHSRANVFIELGYAFGREKECILVSKVGTPVPADLAGLERIEYASYTDLAKQLSAKVGKMLGTPIDKRVIRALVENLEPQGSVIAEFLATLSTQGVTTDKARRSLAALESFGTIEVSDNRVIVRNRELLRSWLPLTQSSG
ncbi:MAG TPA: hypothetical protein VN493_02640 [Thermoanaerobaculia bacterium]|nr:hypothetical protein [Thermoanaerobaculia bacterium]